MAKKKSTSRKPSAELNKLAFLIGKWHTRGEIITAASGSSNEIRGMDTYEWVPGEHFILHRVDVFMGDERTETIEIIGYDKSRKSFFMTSYDSRGASVTMYAVLEKNRVLTFGDCTMRATLTSYKDGSKMRAKWELYGNDNTWEPWLNMEFNK